MGGEAGTPVLIRKFGMLDCHNTLWSATLTLPRAASILNITWLRRALLPSSPHIQCGARLRCFWGLCLLHLFCDQAGKNACV